MFHHQFSADSIIDFTSLGIVVRRCFDSESGRNFRQSVVLILKVNSLWKTKTTFCRFAGKWKCLWHFVFFYYWLFEIWKHVCHASFSKYQSFLFLFEMKLSQSFYKLEPVDSKCPTRENRWHETSPANGRFCIKQNTLRWHYQRKWWSTLSYAYYARESVNDTDFGTCNVQVLTTFTFVISNVVAFEQQLINRQFSFQKPAYFSVMTINLSVIRLIERFTTLWAAIAWRTQKDTHTQKKREKQVGRDSSDVIQG